MVEWLIVLVIVAILLFIGPKKIPALARGLGQALGEFRRGRADVEREVKAVPRGTGEVFRAARELGIPVDGKTEEELRREIATRVQGS